MNCPDCFRPIKAGEVPCGISKTASAPPDCACGKDMIQVLDINGAAVLRFIRLRDDVYYGGTTRYDPDLFYGPHVRLMLGGMLDLLARLADREHPGGLDWSYQLERSGSWYERVSISRHMPADGLARALGCTAQQVRDHYALVVKVA